MLGHNEFSERPSAPEELLPTLVGATVHSFRYSTFIRERDLRAIGITYDVNCGLPPNPMAPKKPTPLIGIFTDNPCPVLHLGYIASQRQEWKSNGTALGEVVYSLALAPGETRNIAVIDLRRRQQGRRQEQTDSREELISNQDHTFALQEVATAVALEHQHGKTSTEANTLVTGGAFVAAGALVGGVGGGIVGTLVEPGVGTAVGAGVGAGAGVAAGGLVFAGAQALGMIEAESSGDREIMAESNQRIAQSTSQQSALIRSLWSTVVTEDIQQETLGVRTSNITNYNHMHALNMEYYEVLHRYDTITRLQRVTPILYLPFAALSFHETELVEEFWSLIRLGIGEDLQAKGDAVFVDPPPQEFVPENVPNSPDAPVNVTILDPLYIDVLIDWDQEVSDAARGFLFLALGGGLLGPPLGALMSQADEIFKSAVVEIELNGSSFVRHSDIKSTHLASEGVTRFRAKFNRDFQASEITGVKVMINSPADLFDDGITLRVQIASGKASPEEALTLPGLQIFSGSFEYDSSTKGTEIYPWFPDSDIQAQYEATLAGIELIEQRNADGADAHQAVLDQLSHWKDLVLAAVKNEPYRFTKIILSNMETARLTWILDRLFVTGDDPNEDIAIPLHQIADTVPTGISGDSILLRMKTFDELSVLSRRGGGLNLDDATASSIVRLLRWTRTLEERFKGGHEDLSVCDAIFLPGAGVFSEAILGRANAAEYIDPDRYWNWQDSPIPHQAPGIQAVSTAPRAAGPLSTDPTLPDATLPLVSPPVFPAPVGLAGVLEAVQNGDLFRDMSKADQLTTILGGLANLAGDTAKTAATMTGDAAANALNSATEIGKTVADLTQKLMAQAPKQAAAPPKNPTTATAASNAVEGAQGKSPDVLDATKEAWGVPGTSNAGTGSGTSSAEDAGSTPATPSWQPEIPGGKTFGPGDVSKFVAPSTQIQGEVEATLQDTIDTVAQDTGAMPDSSLLVPELEHWYRDGIIPLLVFARHNEEYLNAAIRQYFDWLATTAQLGLDNEAAQMETLHGSGMTLITVGLENAIRAAFGQMEAHNNLGFIADVLDWIAKANQLGLDTSDSPLFDPNSVSADSPIHVVLNGPITPVDDSGLGDEFDLTASGGLAIGANPPLPGKIVHVEVTIQNGTATPSSGVMHPALNFESRISRSNPGPMTVSLKGAAALLQGTWTFETATSVVLGT